MQDQGKKKPILKNNVFLKHPTVTDGKFFD